MRETDYAIRLERIRKSYGAKIAVDDFDLAVPKATITGLLGPNGAGKTTTIRILLDIIGPDSGIVEVLGERIYRVGVLMTGKRPTLAELARWVRYG